MIGAEIYISTTWLASTSFIPFDKGMINAMDVAYQNTKNRGEFATTAVIMGVYESQIYEKQIKDNMDVRYLLRMRSYRMDGNLELMNAMGANTQQACNQYQPGTILETQIRKLKALKASPNRSGVQVTTQLVKGNKLKIHYVAQGELVRP